MKIKKIINKNTYTDVLSTTNKLTLYVRKKGGLGNENIIFKTGNDDLFTIFSKDIAYDEDRYAGWNTGFIGVYKGWVYNRCNYTNLIFSELIDKERNTETYITDYNTAQATHELSEEFLELYRKLDEFKNPEVITINDEVIVMYSDDGFTFSIRNNNVDENDENLLNMDKLDVTYKAEYNFIHYIPELNILVDNPENPSRYVDYDLATEEEQENAKPIEGIEKYSFVKYIIECGMLIKSKEKSMYIVAFDMLEFTKMLIKGGKKMYYAWGSSYELKDTLKYARITSFIE